MTIPVLVAGDDFSLLIDLTKTDVPFVVGVGDEVKACVVALDHKSAWCAVVTQSPSADGASWAAGRVAVVFAAAVTATIVKAGLAQIEVQVSQGGIKSTWFAGVLVVKGQIA